MILVLIMIYGFLFRLKNNKVIKTIESFETNLNGVNKLYQSSQSEFLNGKWSSTSSKVLGNKVTNTITFNMIDDMKGTMIYKNHTFDIKIDSAGIARTNKLKGLQYRFNPNPLYETYRLSYNTVNELKNVPVLEMISLGDQDQNQKTLIFKHDPKTNKMNEKALVIIANNSDSFKSNIPNIDGNLYSIPSSQNIKNYRFKHDAIVGNYMTIDEISTTYRTPKKNVKIIVKYLKEIYNNKINFQLKRNFHFANGQILSTPFSQLFEFDIENDKGILISLKHKNLKKELTMNKLVNKFYNITSFCYLHKCISSNKSYNFTKPNLTFSRNELLLKNDANLFFSDTIYAPDISSITKSVNSKFKAKLIGSINNYDKNDFNKGINTENTINFNY